ncbi:hypothetical protein SCHPADRAFT_930207 [Schizopora paradoxa]|uniref:Uncharacterized protein n=1 Tax=Schizopora paradoxa TaxID=27342 RepID=A0A0H2RHE4_9AGAM|nr:hypothetical protein SCHPADRAFT_930207 [Schizopora paradoxa]
MFEVASVELGENEDSWQVEMMQDPNEELPLASFVLDSKEDGVLLLRTATSVDDSSMIEFGAMSGFPGSEETSLRRSRNCDETTTEVVATYTISKFPNVDEV